MDTPIKNSRKEGRVFVAHSVNLGNAGGITRDISASGTYVETDVPDVPYALGSKINPTIKLNSPWGKLLLKCDGEIVRIENRNGGIGLAVKVIEFVMESDS